MQYSSLVERPDFPLILPVKSDRFLHVSLAQFMRSLSFGHFLKAFFLLRELVLKDIFYHKKTMMSQIVHVHVKGQWVCHGQFGAFEVSMGNKL